MKVALFRDLPSERWYSMERYGDELFAALAALGVNVRQYVLPRPLPNLRGRAGAWFNHFWRMAVYPLTVSHQQGDVNHILDHSYAHLLYRLDPRRTVVTCHDIAPLALNEGRHGLSRQLWDISFRALESASRIVVISNSTRQEVLRYTQIPAHQICLVYYGVNEQFRQALPLARLEQVQRQWSTEPRPFIVHVGSCLPRKKVEAILEALPLLGVLRPLFIQVGGQFSEAQKNLIKKLQLQNVVYQVPSAHGQDLLALYQSATVFVFPSYYEGFGLPVLEAMAAGVPVICSNATSLPEVAGEAALMFDPHDADSLAAHLQAVLTDATLRARMIEAGRAQSQRFTWENTARATLAVYQQL